MQLSLHVAKSAAYGFASDWWKFLAVSAIAVILFWMTYKKCEEWLNEKANSDQTLRNSVLFRERWTIINASAVILIVALSAICRICSTLSTDLAKNIYFFACVMSMFNIVFAFFLPFICDCIVSVQFLAKKKFSPGVGYYATARILLLVMSLICLSCCII